MTPLASPAERRALFRVYSNTLGPLTVRGANTECQSFHVHDFSIGGVAVLSTCPLNIGDSLAVEGGPNGKTIAEPLQLEVRHITSLSPGEWLVGCRFSRYLKVRDLQILG